MTLATKEAPPGGEGTSLELSSLGGVDIQANIPNEAPAQAKKRGGRAARDKGNRFERAVVKLLQDRGIAAERVPLSGSAGGSYAGDFLGRDLVVEAKARAKGFARLYSWLEGRDVLIIKGDRRDALVILPLRLAVEIAIARQDSFPRICREESSALRPARRLLPNPTGQWADFATSAGFSPGRSTARWK